ncbi:MAG: mechanosensitive ion channel [Deltaproteobacteria bacterium]|nr:mechanosensitive ion channel [Deltaproteobacteria bacterium]MBW2535034.1 mechanosensitive ion channel [Deltaproteobacteria bacterium]
MDHIKQRLQSFLDPAAAAAWLGTFVPKLVTAILVLIAFYLLAKAARRAVTFVRRRTKLDATVAAFVDTALRYVLMTIAVLTALGELGINTTSILASLGILGLTIGFAAKDTLSNVISGLFIFWDRPFVVDDLIEIDGRYGRVQEITLRSPRVVTPDGKMLAIPNSTIVNTTVASYTNFPHLRLEVPLTVGVGEDLGRVRRLFLELVESDDRYCDEQAPGMVVKAINDYNVEVEFRVWLEDEKAHIAERFELRERIFEALREAGVEMPYETFQLAPFELETRQKGAA